MTSQGARTPRLLLVEDDAADVERITLALGALRGRLDVRVVTDGERALEYLEGAAHVVDGGPDLVLLDLNLPVRSGLDVLERLKTDERLRVVPVVVLTASDADVDAWKAYQHHANAYLVKPNDPRAFEDMLRCFVDFYLGAVKLPGRSGKR